MELNKKLLSCLNSDIYKEWTKGAKVIEVAYNPHAMNVICLIEEDENTYSIFRFFEIGENENWTVSGDARNTDAENAMATLMNYISDNRSGCLYEPNKAFDKHGERISIGDDVDCDETEDNEQFCGVVKDMNFQQGFAIVEDQQGDSFCIDFDKLEVFN